MRKSKVSLMVGALTASIALAGCQKEVDNSKSNVSDDAISAKAIAPTVIDPDKFNKGDKPWTIRSGFQATYDALIVFKFDADMKLVGNAYYFSTKGNTFDKIQDNLQNAMTKIAADTLKIGDFGFIKSAAMPAGLKFKSTTNVVILFDHSGLKFPDCKSNPGNNDTGCRQMFFSDKTIAGDSARDNDTFYNLTKQSISYKIGDKTIARDAIYFQNFNRKKKQSGTGDDAVEANDRLNYNFNIITVASDGSGLIPGWPIIIDPDTGNYGNAGQP